MKQSFYSNGKLLLAGEYVVLDGANALGVPTVYGQYLDVTPDDSNTIKWRGLENDGSVWYEDEIGLGDILAGHGRQTAETAALIKILHIANKLNPAVLTRGYRIETRLSFPRKWGLGSSSTLINNVAWWFGIDPYTLLWQSFGGSGYDIACARTSSPVIFRKEAGKAITEPVNFQPAFAENLWFVYLNRKQNSRTAIEHYRSRGNDNISLAKKINGVTSRMLSADGIEEFMEAMEAHEDALSPALGMQPVKQLLFPDFDGAVKSLGAWGGDFILAASRNNPGSYFRNKGFETIFSYNDMILK